MVFILHGADHKSRVISSRGIACISLFIDIMLECRTFFSDLTEDYPPSFSMEEFNKIGSYARKLRYANAHLTRLASGSGRTVFKVDEQKVLKIAKNRKGLAQNSVEAEGYLQNYDIVAKVFETDQNDIWIEMELAKKVSKSRFAALTGVTIEQVDRCVRYTTYINKGHPSVAADKAAVEDLLANNEFIIDLVSLNADYDMATGDQGRLSTYGEVLRDGKPRIVLVDFGLTNQVYNDFYKVEMK
jgi:hypothetical protein